ncbi:hypothetical protein [Kingella oralis]|uniref:hypothetical protein n=1 Tax=Kingella oralis TaxID=505 RepID=UPI002D7EAC4B|nr:hypothetical protein [Kingella oralis]
MNSIKAHIDSKQFTDLFDQRYIKSLDGIRKSGAYPRYTINISNIEYLLRDDDEDDPYGNRECYRLNSCYKIDNNLLILIPLPSGPLDSDDPYLLNKYILFTEKFVAEVMMDGKESIVVDISGNKIYPTDNDIDEIKDIIFKFINSGELITEFMGVELIMNRNQTNFTILGME